MTQNAIFNFGPFQVEIDVNKTRAFYKNAPLVSENCSCAGCRNYEKAVTTLSSDVTEFFSNMGIDIKKVCEVYVNCVNSDGSLLYGGFYHVCGVLLTGKSAWIPISQMCSYWEEMQTFQVENGFHISFQKECSLLEADFPLPALQLDISANIPWTLSEKNTYL